MKKIELTKEQTESLMPEFTQLMSLAEAGKPGMFLAQIFLGVDGIGFAGCKVIESENVDILAEAIGANVITTNGEIPE